MNRQRQKQKWPSLLTPIKRHTKFLSLSEKLLWIPLLIFFPLVFPPRFLHTEKTWRFTAQHHRLWVFFLFFKVTPFCCEPWLQTEQSAKPRKTCWTVKECKEMWGLQRGGEREYHLTKAARLLQGRPRLAGNQELPPRLPSGLRFFSSLERKTDRWQYLIPPCTQVCPRGGPTEYTATGSQAGCAPEATPPAQPEPGTVFARGLKGIFYFILQRCPFCWQK